jgi:hypothetical protein
MEILPAGLHERVPRLAPDLVHRFLTVCRDAMEGDEQAVGWAFFGPGFKEI